ncbi:hypothetical protein ABBQ38_015316 [Trebouxia sp. C0009 RCD-2024]
MASSSASGSKLEKKLKGLEEQKAAELKRERGTRDRELLDELNKDLDRVQAAITALSSARPAEAVLGEGRPSKKAKTGVADLDREAIAALINKKLPTASSYSKTTDGGWADSRYKTIWPCMNFHRQRTLQE